jgi:hypothetical protein
MRWIKLYLTCICFLKIKLTHHWFKASSYICTSWIDPEDFLHFASSLARAPYHQSSTHRRPSLSPLSHAHRPSAQQHPRWRTSQPSLASRTACRHVNSCKKIFWNAAASCGVINSSFKNPCSSKNPEISMHVFLFFKFFYTIAHPFSLYRNTFMI